MGRNNRRQFPYRDAFHGVDLMMDSIEECDFLEWCVEAAQLGLVEDFQYQPPSIKLFDAVDFIALDGKKKSLLREHVYSPDFLVVVKARAYQTLAKEFKLPHHALQSSTFQVYLDVKGTFQKSDGGRSFSLNQKWVYQKTGTYIVKTIPKDFFQKCGCPQQCFKTRKTGKTRKAFAACKCIEEVFGLTKQELA